MWVQDQQHKYSDAFHQEKNQTNSNSTHSLHDFEQLHRICNKPIEDLKRTIKLIPNAIEFRSDLVKLLATAANLLVIFDDTFDNSSELQESTEESYSCNADVHIENVYPKAGDPLTKFRSTSTSTTLFPIKLDKGSMTEKFDKCCMTDILHEHLSVPYEGRYQNSIFQKQLISEETQTAHLTIPRLRTAFEKRLAEVRSTLKSLEFAPEWKNMSTKQSPTSPPTRLSAGEDDENKNSYVSVDDENQDNDDQLDIKTYKPSCTCRSHAKKKPRKMLTIPNPPNTPLETIFKSTDATVPIRTRDGRLMELEEVVTPSVIKNKIREFPAATFLMARKERWLRTTNMLPQEEVDTADQHTRKESTGSLVSKTTRSSKQFFNR